MHSYASDSVDRRVAPWCIAICAIGVAYGYWVFSRAVEFSLPWWFETPSIMLVYGLLHWAYDSWLWKLKALGFALSQIPNCAGTWFGVLRSSHDGNTTIEGMIVVHQTWSRIAVEFQSESSVSYSRMAALNVTAGASQGLIYEYTNEPRADAKETMHAHRGFAFLRLSADGNWLEGDYYTGRDRTNFGTMRLRRVAKRRLNLQDAKKEFSRVERDAT
jgi:hypothetical protein